jgi:hypothetical protein
MRAIRVDAKIIAMAAGLRLQGRDPIQSIVDYCQRRVMQIIKGVKGLQTISDVEKLICERLNLVIHEIWRDEDLRRFSRKYAEAGDAKIAALDMELESDDAYGIIYERSTLSDVGDLQYVAFVDCRGKKAHRRFFTRWHEIAHRLTAFKQFEMPFLRVTAEQIEKEPLEQLMDKIAGEIGFWDPLFVPVLNSEIRGRGLTFEAVDNVRSRFCFDASSQATLNACAARLPFPIVILHVGLAYKKEEKRLLKRGSSLKPTLRVIWSMPNQAARDSGLHIHKMRRIPMTSVIAKLHSAPASQHFAEGQENLATWVSSDGTSLGNREVFIRARKFDDQVLAIVTLPDSN